MKDELAPVSDETSTLASTRHRDVKNAQHTAGPWKIDHGPGTGQRCVIAADSTWVCGQIWNQPGRMPRAEAEANARLIAAAPCLLEALRALAAVAEVTTFSDQYPAECEDARAAIAKAQAQ